MKNDIEMIPFLKKKINELQLRVYELKEMSINAGAIRYDKDPVQTSPNGGRLEKMVTEYCELERQIGFLKIDLKNQIAEFEKIYDLMDDDKEKMFLRMKYVEGVETGEMQKAFSCSRWTLYRLDKKALKSYRILRYKTVDVS